MDQGLVAICISGAMFAFFIFDRVWGAGNRTATSEASMRTYVDNELAELRKEVFLKHDTSEGNIGQAIQQMKDLLHKQELDALTFRAEAAEKYMRRDSYYTSMGELKVDIAKAFEKLDKRLDRMEENLPHARAKRD